MDLVRNFDEMLLAAMAIEEQGSVFYKRAAAVVDDALARQLFLDLVEWENTHYQLFAAARDRLTPEQKMQQSLAEGLDIESILASGAMKVTRDPASLIDDATPPEQVLDLAISLERDSIVFYMLLHRFLPDDGRRDELDTIVREEVGHVRHLQELRARLRPTVR
jgi:rubrerythrin